MKKHSLASKILWIAFAVFLLGAILLGSMAVLKEYEKTANYFIPDAILAPITVILGTIAISCGVAAVCTTKRTDLSENIFPDNHHFPLTAIGFFGAAVLLLLSFTSVLALIALPFLILASAYCILTGSAILIFIFALMQCARVIYLLRGIKAESKEEESTQSLAEDVSEPTEQSDHISDEEKEGTDR